MKDTTRFLDAYEAIVDLGSAADLAAETEAMQARFMKRTGSFRPEDPWFETRSRAFWDDALTTQGFAVLVAERAGHAELAVRFERAHRGLFAVVDGALIDRWSGAELEVTPLDEAQAVDLKHAEGLVDARVVAFADSGPLFVLPGAFHHPADATDAILKIVETAHRKSMTRGAALDALFRMKHVLESSSRVKASFAYRVESLDRP